MSILAFTFTGRDRLAIVMPVVHMSKRISGGVVILASLGGKNLDVLFFFTLFFAVVLHSSLAERKQRYFLVMAVMDTEAGRNAAGFGWLGVYLREC